MSSSEGQQRLDVLQTKIWWPYLEGLDMCRGGIFNIFVE